MAKSRSSALRVALFVIVVVVIGAFVGLLQSAPTTTSQLAPIDTTTHLGSGLNANSTLAQQSFGGWFTQSAGGAQTELLDSAGYVSSFETSVQSQDIFVEGRYTPICIAGFNVAQIVVQSYHFKIFFSNDGSTWTEMKSLDSTTYTGPGYGCAQNIALGAYKFHFNGQVSGYVRAELWGNVVVRECLLWCFDLGSTGDVQLVTDQAYIMQQAGQIIAPPDNTVFHVGDTITFQVQLGTTCPIDQFGNLITKDGSGNPVPGWLFVIISNTQPQGQVTQLGCGVGPTQPLTVVTVTYVVQPGDFVASQDCGKVFVKAQLWTQYLLKDTISTKTIPLGANQPNPPTVSVSKTTVTEGDSITVTITPPSNVTNPIYTISGKYSDGTLVAGLNFDSTKQSSFTVQVPKPGTITISVNVEQAGQCISSNPASVTVIVQSATGPDCQTNPTDPACRTPPPKFGIWIILLIVGIVSLAAAALLPKDMKAFQVKPFFRVILAILGVMALGLAYLIYPG